jgi:hypothetical protein
MIAVKITHKLRTKQEVLGRTNRILSLMRHGAHRKRRAQQFFYCCVCIRWRGNVFTEPLPSNNRTIFTEPLPATIGRYIYRYTDWWEIFMKYAVEMGSGAMMYVPSFIQIGSAIQMLIRGDTQTAWGSHKPIFLFWKNRVGLWDHVAVRVCLCVSAYTLIVARQRLRFLCGPCRIKGK